MRGEVPGAGSTGGAGELWGARVTLYNLTDEQENSLSAALADLQKQTQKEKDANARVFPAESTVDSDRSTLAGYNNLSDTKHCFALEKVLDKIRKSPVPKPSPASPSPF